jgi:hypothetical protein
MRKRGLFLSFSLLSTRKKQQIPRNFAFSAKKVQNVFVSIKKSSTFALALRKRLLKC